LLGGKPDKTNIAVKLWCFPQGRRFVYNAQFSRTGRLLPSFFYALSQLAFKITIQKVFAFKHSKLSLSFYKNPYWYINDAVTYTNKHFAEPNTVYKLRPHNRQRSYLPYGIPN